MHATQSPLAPPQVLQMISNENANVSLWDALYFKVSKFRASTTRRNFKMGQCPPQTFNNITPEQFATLCAKAQAAGIP